MTLDIAKFIGHRGVKGLAPENTLVSFIKAKQLGFSWVEFDVMLTACGEAVVFHDQRLKRTTNGKGLIARRTYPELKKLDAGSWFSPEFSQETIPTLSETLACLLKLGLQANIEIKPARGMEVATAQKALAIIRSHWPQNLPKPLISSFSLTSLYTVRAQDPQAPLAILYNKLPRNWQKAADELNCVAVNLDQQYLSLAQIAQVKQTQRLVLAYTVNQIERANLLFSWGVDGVFTDYPLHAN